MRQHAAVRPRETYNRWTVVGPVVTKSGRREYECVCICGTRNIVQGKHLIAGRSKSCGCYRKEVLSEKYSAKIAGQRFGRLTVVERVGSTSRHNALWICRCDCGNETRIASPQLLSGHTKSCGCISNTTHGHSRTRTYKIWTHIKQRCLNPNNDQWADYGGRGIAICDRWRSFENFLADMGDAPARLSIERINTNGNYELENCKWATSKEQARNKRVTRFVKLEGVEMVLQDAIDHLRKVAYLK